MGFTLAQFAQVAPTPNQMGSLTRDFGLAVAIIVVCLPTIIGALYLWFRFVMRPRMEQQLQIEHDQAAMRIQMDTDQSKDYVLLIREQRGLTADLRAMQPLQMAQLAKIVDLQEELVKANESHGKALEAQGQALQNIVSQTTGVLASTNTLAAGLKEHQEKMQAGQEAAVEAIREVADRRYPKADDTGDRRREADERTKS